MKTKIFIFVIAIVLSLGYLILVEDILRLHGLDEGMNDCSAIGTLKLLVSTEGTWKQTDTDRNGIKDYWTLDVSCLHRMYREIMYIKVNFVAIELARADGAAYSRNNPSPFNLGNANGLDIQDWGSTATLSDNFTTTAKSGYYFRAMLLDEEGIPYNQNPVGKNGIKACNTDKFAFVAYPSVAGVSGYNIYIVNEKGHIYQTKCMNDATKIVLQWPAKDPTTVGWELCAPPSTQR